jgi:hypothetical protein
VATKKNTDTAIAQIPDQIPEVDIATQQSENRAENTDMYIAEVLVLLQSGFLPNETQFVNNETQLDLTNQSN